MCAPPLAMGAFPPRGQHRTARGPPLMALGLLLLALAVRASSPHFSSDASPAPLAASASPARLATCGGGGGVHAGQHAMQGQRSSQEDRSLDIHSLPLPPPCACPSPLPLLPSPVPLPAELHSLRCEPELLKGIPHSLPWGQGRRPPAASQELGPLLVRADARGWSVRVLGVFDGHGGQEASALAATELPSALASSLHEALCGAPAQTALIACQAPHASEGARGTAQACQEQRVLLKAAIRLAAAQALRAVDAHFCQVRPCLSFLHSSTRPSRLEGQGTLAASQPFPPA